MIHGLLFALLPQASLPPVPPQPSPARGVEEVEEVEEVELEEPIEEALTKTQLLHGGRIRLGDANDGVVEALLIQDGRVIAAGTEAALSAGLPEEAVRIDLDGAVAVPGLQDSHGHVEEYGASLEMLDLRGLESVEAVVAVVAEEAREAPEGSWIVGRGWDQNLWAGGSFPDHESLSLAVPDHPVFLYRVDGDAALVNQKALELAELDGELDELLRSPGVRVLVDENQHATGVLLDGAMQLVARHLPEPEPSARRRWILAAQEQLLARGLTCVHDMGVSLPTLQVYLELREEGLLQLRIVVYLADIEGLSVDQLKGLASLGDERDLLTVAGVKFIADGGLASWGAAMLADYSDRPGEQGCLRLTEQVLTGLVHDAWRAGLQPAVHAEGDRANRTALNVFERMLQVDQGFAALRPRIEHAHVISTRDIPRFPQLGVIPSMQPSQAIMNSPWIDSRLGKRRARRAFLWRSLAPGILDLAFGSDFPTQDPDPLAGMHAARSRQELRDLTSDGFLAEERLDGPAALSCFTYGAAHAAHQEDRRGRLQKGYFADLTVLNIDPAECPSDALKEAKVLLTVINGEVVYRR